MSLCKIDTYIYIYIYIFVYTRHKTIHMHVHIQIHIHGDVHVCVYIYIHVYDAYICIYIYIYTNVYICVCAGVRMCVYMCVYTCVYVCVYTLHLCSMHFQCSHILRVSLDSSGLVERWCHGYLQQNSFRMCHLQPRLKQLQHLKSTLLQSLSLRRALTVKDSENPRVAPVSPPMGRQLTGFAHAACHTPMKERPENPSRFKYNAKIPQGSYFFPKPTSK